MTSTLLSTVPVFPSPLSFNISAMFGKIDQSLLLEIISSLATGIPLSPDLSPTSLVQLIVALQS